MHTNSVSGCDRLNPVFHLAKETLFPAAASSALYLQDHQRAFAPTTTAGRSVLQAVTMNRETPDVLCKARNVGQSQPSIPGCMGWFYRQLSGSIKVSVAVTRYSACCPQYPCCHAVTDSMRRCLICPCRAQPGNQGSNGDSLFCSLMG